MAAFFNEACAASLLESLIVHSLQLNQGDVEAWADEPEEFISHEESCTNVESAKSAGEHLFMVLLTSNQSAVVVRSIVSAISGHEAQYSNEALLASIKSGAAPSQIVLQRDVLYLVAGLAAFQLEGTINFSEWLVGKLVPLMRACAGDSGKSLASSVLQRRVLWLVGCFVAQLSADLRPSVYESIFDIMVDPARDLVVRLAASTSAKALLDDWDFDADAFVPYLVPAVNAAYALLRDVSMSEIQLQLFALLEQIVNRAGGRLVTASSPRHGESREETAIGCILRPLPWLWEQCSHADRSLLRSAIVRMLTRIISSAGVMNELLGSVVLPILSYATDLSQDDNVYLLGDAVELWEAVASHVPVHTPEMHALLPRIEPIVRHDMSTLRGCVHILEDSFLLGSETIFTDKVVCSAIAGALDAAVGNVRPRGSVGLVRCMETMLRCDHAAAAQLLAPIIVRMIRMCFGDRSSAPAAGGDARHAAAAAEEVPCDLVLVGYLTIIARVLLLAQPSFASCLERAAIGARWGGRTGDLFAALIKLVVSKFDAVDSSSAGPWRRKTWSMCLCAALTFGGTPLPQVLEMAPEIFSACSSVWRELSEEEQYISAGDTGRESVRSLASGDERRGSLEDLPKCFSAESDSFSECAGVSEGGVAARRRDVFAADPVVNADIVHASKKQFHSMRHLLSVDTLNLVATCVDPDFAAMLSQG